MASGFVINSQSVDDLDVQRIRIELDRRKQWIELTIGGVNLHLRLSRAEAKALAYRLLDAAFALPQPVKAQKRQEAPVHE